MNIQYLKQIKHTFQFNSAYNVYLPWCSDDFHRLSYKRYQVRIVFGAEHFSCIVILLFLATFRNSNIVMRVNFHEILSYLPS